jgi:predicted PurR-regulated permease PerM
MSSQPSAQLVLTISRGFLWRLLLLIAAVILVCFAGEVLVVAFAGILLAVVLHTFTEWVQHATHLGQRWAYLLVIALIIGLATGAIVLLGPRIVNQVSEIAKVIPQSLQGAEAALNQHDWGRYLTQAAQRGLHVSTWHRG